MWICTPHSSAGLTIVTGAGHSAGRGAAGVELGTGSIWAPIPIGAVGCAPTGVAGNVPLVVAGGP